MSWNFMVKGATKAAVKAAVMADKNVAEWKYCPMPFAEGICISIDGLPEPQPGSELVVNTYGHVTDGGSGGKQHCDNASVSFSYRPSL